MGRGKAIVIVAPSGTGKSTLIRRLMEKFPMIEWSVSCTTRPTREGEKNGVDYHFLSEEVFKQKIEQDQFVEWAIVHSNYYGTSKEFVEQGLSQGKILLLDLDVQGADSMKQYFKDEAQIIFIEPPSLEALRERLIKRDTDSIEVINERLQNAKKEIERKEDYDFCVLNAELEKAYSDLEAVFKEIMGL